MPDEAPVKGGTHLVALLIRFPPSRARLQMLSKLLSKMYLVATETI